MTKVLVVATSRKTRGGITSVVKAHETGEQWKKYHCCWIETHRDGNAIRKMVYLVIAFIEYVCLLPFYDIVHIHVGLNASVRRKIVFARLARLYKKIILVHFHPSTEKHLFDKAFSEDIHKLFCYADKLLVLSPQWEKWIGQAFPNDKFKMKVVLNPCPVVKRDDTKRKKTILYAGILSDRKGYARLIEAFAKISERFQDWSLVIVGNGELENAKKLCEEYGVVDRVSILGWVSGNDKEQVFQEASIYCLPSWGEGFPMGVLDAMAYGIPVVTTPVGGVEQVLTDSINCLIFDAYDIGILAEKLSFLMQSENIRKKMVGNADKLVESIFNISNICRDLGNIYEEFCDEIDTSKV